MLTTRTSARFTALLDARRAEEYLAAGYWATTTLLDDLDRHAAARPDGLALIDEDHRLTWAQYRQLVHRLAAAFVARGVQPGDIVSFALPGQSLFNITELALMSIGAVPNPLLRSYGAREWRDITRRTGTRLLIVPAQYRGRDFAGQIVDLRLPVDEILVAGGTAPPGTASYDALLAESSEDAADCSEMEKRRPAANDICSIIYSAGTTGQPKGNMHTHNTMRRASLVCGELLGLGLDGPGLAPGATGTAVGSLLGVYMPLVLGCPVVWLDQWDPSEALRIIEQERVAWSYGPTVFPQSVIRHPERGRFDLSSLVVWGTGGAPVPRELLLEATAAGFRLQSMFGSSEAIWVTSQRVDDPPEKLATSDGRLVPGMELRVVDGDGDDVAPGEVGEFLARGPQLCMGYFDDPELTRAAFDSEGWFHSGDLVSMDQDGYIKVAGRKKDMIIRKGLNIFPLEIEYLFEGHPDIAEIAIVGVPDPDSGERAVACVVQRSPSSLVNLNGIVGWLRARQVAPFKWPEDVVVLDELPKGPTGKVLKYVLRQKAAEILHVTT